MKIWNKRQSVDNGRRSLSKSLLSIAAAIFCISAVAVFLLMFFFNALIHHAGIAGRDEPNGAVLCIRNLVLVTGEN